MDTRRKEETMKILSAILLLITTGLNLKHGWDAFRPDPAPGQDQMLTDLGLPAGATPIIGVLSNRGVRADADTAYLLRR